MATRHQVRQAVASLLYVYEMGTYSDDFAIEFLDEKKIKNEQRNFAFELLNGILADIKALDNEINLRLTSFKLNELGSMERAILRLGAFEILSKKSDGIVSISEAVLLANEFGADSATKLVNGVLNSIYKGEIPKQDILNQENLLNSSEILKDNLPNKRFKNFKNLNGKFIKKSNKKDKNETLRST